MDTDSAFMLLSFIQDAREWKWREEEIEQIQRDRLALVERLVAERAGSDHAHQQRRLDEVCVRNSSDSMRFMLLYSVYCP